MRTPTFFLLVFGLPATYCAAADTILLGLSQRSPQTAPSTSEVAKEYLIFPKNGTDEDALSKTEESIKKVIESEKVYSLRNVNKRLVFWIANVTNTQLNKIREDDGVRSAEENVIAYEEAAALLLPTTTAQSSTSIPTKVKRDISFATQTDAVDELVVISQPDTIPNLDDLANPDDYEFPKGRTDFLQTELSRKEKQDPATDESDDSHGSYVASKATGTEYGSAKKATLVVVKMKDRSLGEIIAAWIFALQDIKDKQRTKKSVITMSLCSIDPVDPNNLSDARKEERNAIEEAFKNDVPVLAAAGNKAEKERPDGKLREEIDTAPAVYASPDFPIIVVGSTDSSGKRAATSQGGDKVTLLAQGVKVVCQGKPFAPRIMSGTSFLRRSSSQRKPVGFEQGVLESYWNKVTEKDNPKKSESLSGPACATKPEGKNVRDSHEEALIKAVGYFCNADAATTVPVGPELNRTVEVVIDGPANAAHYKAQDWSNKRDIDDVCFFTLTTVDDCETPRNGYNLAKPLGDHTCNDILYRSWKDYEFLSFPPLSIAD
ncbi:hypothetical protein W97_02580 [Coniosporium apollinis CBS 100218]|uniref:Peptidase S8/S53 domain-containing protein n=1 Tax=Coniosporium apollinis (strain CBS 100218) TaxID=1168221 RepID=R7YNA4_CONA1|nr:uncharacterized protein W97_02580 [Coniosporium apollinis CBS 100218]EON63353.1 hypothetical protein W97_02580 [Coniosporium apollinis CBS 100218]